MIQVNCLILELIWKLIDEFLCWYSTVGHQVIEPVAIQLNLPVKLAVQLLLGEPKNSRGGGGGGDDDDEPDEEEDSTNSKCNYSAKEMKMGNFNDGKHSPDCDPAILRSCHGGDVMRPRPIKAAASTPLPSHANAAVKSQQLRNYPLHLVELNPPVVMAKLFASSAVALLLLSVAIAADYRQVFFTSFA